MNERIKKLAHQADDYADAMDYHGKNYIGLRDNYFAELIALECARIVKASSPDGMIGVNAIRIHFGIEP